MGDSLGGEECARHRARNGREARRGMVWNVVKGSPLEMSGILNV